uniref:sn-1-specific diacylglycerol lipase n=1 Tax=Rhodosorus marinus TaxID=101924 RepID=A0A7S3A825_9RHOD|mmetsp:Transcript_6729/g.28776  ORF Transcript_6729/g.28776 Transcript_6729/m.28776 type:complete len:580 (+) Transcript_6729:231-1970(+)
MPEVPESGPREHMLVEKSEGRQDDAEPQEFGDGSSQIQSVDGMTLSGVDSKLKVDTNAFRDQNSASGDEFDWFTVISRVDLGDTTHQRELFDNEFLSSKVSEDFSALTEKAAVDYYRHRRGVDEMKTKVKSDIKCCCICYGCTCRPRSKQQVQEDPRQLAIAEFDQILLRAGLENLNTVDYIRGYRAQKRIRYVRKRAVNEPRSSVASHSSVVDELPNERIRFSDYNIRKFTVEELRAYVRLAKHAQAAYGRNFNQLKHFYRRLPENPLNVDRAVILGKLDLNDADVEVFPSKGPFQPLFYIALDHAYKSVVVSVRGSATFNDVMTDLAASPITFVARDPRGRNKPVVGATHIGMFLSAKHVATTSKPVLLRLALEQPTYAITVTGHSLGAGAAVLATIMMRNDADLANKNVRCFAVGSPPILTKRMASVHHTVITSLVNNNDVVPRLSVVGLANYFEVCKAVHELPRTRKVAIDLRMWKRARLDEIELPDLTELEPSRLVLGGRILHMRTDKNFNTVTKCLYHCRCNSCRGKFTAKDTSGNFQWTPERHRLRRSIPQARTMWTRRTILWSESRKSSGR